jgi:hypothetical protein
MRMAALSVKHRLMLDPPWSEMPPLQLGKLREGAADLYVTIARNDRPVLRVDIYAGRETFAFTDAIAWGERAFAGYGDAVYVIDPARKTGSAIALNTYFGSFFATSECLIAASGERLWRLSPSGLVLWTSQQLGLDGVVVNAIENGLIKGEGEWDPPGGWRPFAISLDLGVPVV